MGYNTHYLGSLRIDPPLNPQETAWLRAFRRSHRALQADPYDVPMNPGVIPDDHPLVHKVGCGYAFPGRAEVGLSHCDWEPSSRGSRLQWVEIEKSNNALQTLRYIVDHFLRPGAHAQADRREEFAPFTFDHVVSGIVAAERDDGELFLIVAKDNALEKTVLVQGAGVW